MPARTGRPSSPPPASPASRSSGGLVLMVWSVQLVGQQQKKQLAALQARSPQTRHSARHAAARSPQQTAGRAGRRSGSPGISSCRRALEGDARERVAPEPRSRHRGRRCDARERAGSRGCRAATTTATDDDDSDHDPGAGHRACSRARSRSPATPTRSPRSPAIMRRLSFVPWLSDVSLVSSSSKTSVGADTLFAVHREGDPSSPRQSAP